MNRTRSGEPRIPVIDLFAGPGGLGEGFSAPEEVGGTGRFRIALSVEKDPQAHETLELRALFRQFDYGCAPREYYALIRRELDRGQLFGLGSLKDAVAAARAEAWNAELGVEPEASVRERAKAAIGRAEESVLIGGPPCQAYSLVGRSRNRGNPSYDAAKDGRHTLYREYLKVLAWQQPAVFVMENVKGLLSARLNHESVFGRILDDLRAPGRAIRKSDYSRASYHVLALVADQTGQVEMFDAEQDDPRSFIVRCEDFGIPQARHRVILLGVRADIDVPRGLALQPAGAVSAAQVLKGLPKVRSGLSGIQDSADGWRDVLVGFTKEPWIASLRRTSPDIVECIESSVSEAERRRLGRGAEYASREASTEVYAEWYRDPLLDGIAHHSTRAHIQGDLRRYLFASSFAKTTGRSPSLREFPAALLPKHRNVHAAVKGGMFGDRFRVQVASRPSTTVTSHIAKDGHYYIHYDPSQCRSLTAREAARLQTFPDNYLFCGGRTAQYHQIGNAVPPLLARQIAKVVGAILS
jgi:DNA (cytosine-5)-methyltransferase 1